MTTAIRARFGRVQVVTPAVTLLRTHLITRVAVPIGVCGPYYPYYGYYGPSVGIFYGGYLGRRALAIAASAVAVSVAELFFPPEKRTTRCSRPWMGNHPRFCFFSRRQIRDPLAHRAKNIFL